MKNTNCSPMMGNLRPIWIVILVLLIAIMIVLGTWPSGAQSSYDWSVVVDFTTTDGSSAWGCAPVSGYFASGLPGSYSAGVGWVSAVGQTGAGPIHYRNVLNMLCPGLFASGQSIVRVTALTDYKKASVYNLCDGGAYAQTSNDPTYSTFVTAAAVNQETCTNSDADNQTWDSGFVTEVTGQNALKILCQDGRSDGSAGDVSDGYCRVHSVTIYGKNTSPWTPTPTPTLPYIPGPTATYTATQSCNLPEPAQAVFTTGWTFDGGATNYVLIPQYLYLNLPPGGSATIQLPLNNAQYSFDVTYQAQGTATGTLVTEVAGMPYGIATSDNAEHTYQSDPLKFGEGSTTIKLSRPAGDSSDVVVKFFCLTQLAVAQTASGGISVGGSSPDTCALCDPPLALTDWTGWVNWLICNLRRLFNCYLLPVLNWILDFLGKVVKYVLSGFSWLIRNAGPIVEWFWHIITSTFGWFGGWLNNGVTAGGNKLVTTGAADAANITSSGVRDLPTAVMNGVNTLGNEIQHVFAEPVKNIFDLVIRLIGLAANTIGYILGLIPFVIQAIIDGINSSAAPVSASPVCSNPSSLLFYPCLGFYILDNTIFAGPAGYVIPLLSAVIVFDGITYIFNRIKEEFSK